MNEHLAETVARQRQTIENMRAECIEESVNRIIYTAFKTSFESSSADNVNECKNDMEMKIARRLATKLRIVRLRVWLDSAKRREKAVDEAVKEALRCKK